MGTIFQKLTLWGCNIEVIKERFLDDEEFYDSCLDVFIEKPGIEEIGDALKRKDYEEAFQRVHTLKGVSANMGLEPITTIVTSMVDGVRACQYEELDSLYQELVRVFQEFTKMR